MFTHNGRTIPLAPVQDPNNKDTWGADWSDILQDGVTLAKSRFILPNDLVSIDEWCTPTHTKIRMSGGIAGKNYTLTNRIIDSEGNTLDRSMFIVCQNT